MNGLDATHNPPIMRKRFFLSASAVFLLALVLRLLFAADGLANPNEARFSRPDTESYTAPAVSLANLGEYRDAEGKITAHRTPGLPVLLAVLSIFGMESTAWSVVLILLGSLTVYPIYATCRKLLPPNSDAISACVSLLFALNLTAIAHAPMLLSDTLFTLFVAFSLLFFISIRQNKQNAFCHCIFAALFAGLATLVRPVNVLWPLPAIVTLLFLPDMTWKRKGLCCVLSTVVFLCVILPWILRNDAIGAGKRIDASSVITLVHNAAALESNLTGIPEDRVRARYEDEMEHDYASRPEAYATTKARYAHCEVKMLSIILQHPFRYAWLSIRPYTLLPDIPTLLEITGVTVGGRGTFDVLNREGVFAAVRHYFAESGTKGIVAVILTIPLLLIVALLYLLALYGLVFTVRRKDWFLSLVFLLFGVYYLFMPGPVTMPRYQLPALPVFCLFAALALYTLFLRKQTKNAIPPQNTVEK